MKKNNRAQNKTLCSAVGLLCYLATLILPLQFVFGQDKTGLKTSIAVDMVGEFSTNDSSSASDQFLPRGVDMMFYAPVDHLFDATMSVAAHQEAGEAVLELHEAFISSSRLVSGMNLKAGQFFLGIGRLNRFHQHEWPFISTPIVQSRFFDSEGLIDSGLELSYLVPLDVYLDVTVGVTNGYTFGHSHDEGAKPISPTKYVHLKSFVSISGFDLQPGITFLSRTDGDKNDTQLWGFDLVGKLKSGKTLKFLWQSEVWQRHYKPDASSTEIATGSYVYPQIGFENGIRLGFRIDYLTINTLKTAVGDPIDNYESAFIPSLFYQPSEFSRIGLAYRFEKNLIGDQDPIENQMLEFQITYTLGAHPSHDF